MRRFPASFRERFLPPQTVSSFLHRDSHNNLRKLFLNCRAQCISRPFPRLETVYRSGNHEFPGGFLESILARRAEP